MDGDGEDRPEELNLLFNKCKENPNKTVTANRTKRSEGSLFQFLYQIQNHSQFFWKNPYQVDGIVLLESNPTCLLKLLLSLIIESHSNPTLLLFPIFSLIGSPTSSIAPVSTS